jgi:hypothetical protein
MIFRYFRQKDWRKNRRLCLTTKLNCAKKFIITLVCEKERHFFRRKLSKIAENCDHNIDPRITFLLDSGKIQNFADTYIVNF